MWKPTQMGFEDAYAAAGKQKYNGYYKMQDMTSEICNNVTVPSEQSTATLIDIRDNNTYTVAKLLDGKCWMTQNLRIVGSRTLTPEDSDIPTNFTLPTSSLNGFTTFDTANVYLHPSNRSYGAYYTWNAATAGHGKKNLPRNCKINYSICPKSWRLPSTNEDDTIDQLYTYKTIIQSPASFVLAGRIRGQIVTDSDEYHPNGYIFANYWSNSCGPNDNDGRAHVLFITSNSMSSTYGNIWDYEGASIRCIIK